VHCADCEEFSWSCIRTNQLLQSFRQAQPFAGGNYHCTSGGEREMFVTKRRRLKHLCETRWIERHESLLAVVELFPAIVRCLEDMQVDSNVPTARNAAMLLNSLKPCSIIIGLVVAQHISSILLPLTTLLQSKSIDLVDCCSGVDTVVSVLKKYRETPETFNDIFCKASVLSEMIGT